MEVIGFLLFDFPYSGLSTEIILKFFSNVESSKNSIYPYHAPDAPFMSINNGNE